jgi:hypothetical protein
MTEINASTFTASKGKLAFLFEQVSAAPLIVFRVAFGIMMFLSLVRFAANGWIDSLYVQPKLFFTYYGFEWIKPLNATGMYLVFGIMMAAALLIAFGRFYRFSTLTFFLLFTYVELIDKTNYLNHYYFISVMAFLFCLLPASNTTVPRWAILTLQLQMAVVYFFAGIAKINADWLLNAMPLKVWLPTKTDVPVIGLIVDQPWLAYAFSWCGMLFDVCIAFFLFNRRTVWYAYALVVFFHVLTSILFPFIGMFPFIMIVCATIFLPAQFHNKVVSIFRLNSSSHSATDSKILPGLQYAVVALLALHFTIQLLLPFRYVLYPDRLFTTEQGYRFSWRVMLMEKAGIVFFTFKNANGQLVEVNNRNFLTMQQEKQMSTQPDMILQFAHYLKNYYHTNEVYAEAYVTINGRGSRLFLNPRVNLAQQEDNFAHKNWILASAD